MSQNIRHFLTHSDFLTQIPNPESQYQCFSPVLRGNFPVGEFWSGGIPHQMKSGEEIPLRDGASQEKIPHKINPKMMKIQWNTA